MTSKELVVSFFEEVYNKHKAEYILDSYAKDYKEHHPGGANCAMDAVNIIKGTYTTFPDISVIVEDVIEENDLVATRLTFTATQKGEFAGIAPTNKTITFEAMEFFKVEDGRIVQSWGAWPLHDMINKLKG